MTRHSESAITLSSPPSNNCDTIHTPSTEGDDNDNKSEPSCSAPYEPSPELFKKPLIKTIALSSDDEDDAVVDDNQSDAEEENKYEEERRKKIERNKMLLSNLGLANGLLPKNDNTTPTKTTNKRRSTGNGEPTEIRRSSRLSSKPKPVYNFTELEREKRKIIELEKQEKKSKKAEEQKLKYYSRRTLRKRRSEEDEESIDDDSDVSDDNSIGQYNESTRRSSTRNRKKVDYAELEDGMIDEEEEMDEQVTVIESPKKKSRGGLKKSTIASPVCSFSNFVIPDDQAILLTDIGGQMAIGPTDENITHVVTQVYKRTLKLMCGIVRGAYVVTEQWLFDSVEAGYFLDEKPYLIKADNGVNLIQSRKQALKRPIFSELKFFVCDDMPSAEIVNQIIKTGSGSFITDIDEMVRDNNSNNFENCYVIYENEDTKEKYPTLPCDIFKTKEFIFSAAVSQKIQDV